MVPADRKVRPFEPEDLASLHRVRAAAFAPVFRGFREAVGAEIARHSFATAEDDQARHLDEICASADHEVLVVLIAGEIVGFAGFSVNPIKRTAELGLNAVHPDHAGRGIGSWLYGEVLARMRALGAATVEVGTGGDAAHAAARRAYEKAGFTATIPAISYYRLLGG